ncbi:MAG: hypothetical protein CMO55_08820 [Verrucomicrobiales bacterium]|nr:hypothetical protein [Verrucomicrobiales bacterium]
MLEGELSQEVTSFDDGSGPVGGIIGVTSRLEVDPSIEPRFDFDFSVLGEETVIVRFTVPEGKVIQVDPPEGFANSSLGFDCFGGTSGSGITLMPTIGVVFEDLVGVKPSFIPDVSLYSSGSLISLRSYANFSGKLHFKSIEMRILIPEPFSNSYDVDFATFALYAYATASVSSGLTDPGPWLTIIDDPAIAAELALERASLKRELKKVTRKIKRARAKKDRKELRKLRREKRKLKIRLRRLG